MHDPLYGLNQAADLGQQYIPENAQMQDVRQSPIISMAHAIDSVNQLCAQIDAIANRLVGPEPRPVNGNVSKTGTPISEAVFPRIELAAHEMIAVVQRAMYDISRIERALP